MLLSSLFSIDTSTIGIIAQILSLIGATCSFIAFQQKTHMSIMIFKATDSAIFAVSWILLGNIMAMIMSVISIIRNLSFGIIVKKNISSLPLVIFFAIITLILGIVFWSGWGDIFSIVGTILSCVVFGLKKPNHVRLFNIPVNILWLANNILVVVSLGGIITESFSMISSIIGLIRFREKPQQNESK